MLYYNENIFDFIEKPVDFRRFFQLSEKLLRDLNNPFSHASTKPNSLSKILPRNIRSKSSGQNRVDGREKKIHSITKTIHLTFNSELKTIRWKDMKMVLGLISHKKG